MSIFDIFTKNTQPVQQQQSPQQQQAQAQSQPGNLPANAGELQTANGAGTAPNGTVPATVATQENTVKSGLDAFADIWNTEANQGAQGQPLFNVSHDKMIEAARKQNFTAGINPELAAKITAGGPEAVVAMMEMMNTVAQNAYAQSAFAGTQLITGALDKSQFAKASDIDSRVKALGLDANLRTENPMFAHPAAQPLLQSVQAQLLTKFPNATPAELTKMAQDYLISFAQGVNAPQQQQQQQQNAKDAGGMDWSKFL